jgi:hypothetical protein
VGGMGKMKSEVMSTLFFFLLFIVFLLLPDPILMITCVDLDGVEWSARQLTK